MKRQSTPTAVAAQATLMMMTLVLLSSGFVQSAVPEAAPFSNVRIHHAATTLRGGAIVTAEANVSPGCPSTTFPQGAKWSLKKAPPKKSLSFLPIPQDKTAAAWILNLIELTHWAVFPLGFFVAHYLFDSAPTIENTLDSSPSRVFYIILGLLCQIFGVGISGGIRVSSEYSESSQSSGYSNHDSRWTEKPGVLLCFHVMLGSDYYIWICPL